MRKAILTLLAIWMMASPAQALPQGYSGADLLQNCSADASVCDFYLQGLLDAHDTLMVWAQGTSRICSPRSMEPRELWQVVAPRLQARPDRLAASAGSLVLDALRVAYHCAGTAAPAPALAKPYSGVDLANLCATPVSCEALIVGALDAHQTLVDWGRIPKAYTCLPAASNIDEWRLTVLRYLGAHLDSANFSAGSLILLGSAEAYRC